MLPSCGAAPSAGVIRSGLRSLTQRESVYKPVEALGVAGAGVLWGGSDSPASLPGPAPNQGVQATAASVRSCLAPAARRA